MGNIKNSSAFSARPIDRGAGAGFVADKPHVSHAASGGVGEAEAIVRALGGLWSGHGGMCRCPAHDDAHPSLSVAQGSGGRLLLHCFAGCGFRDVLGALRDLGVVKANGNFRPILGRRTVEILKSADDAAEQMRKARAVWNLGQPINGTLAEAYLRRRAIRTALPASLRFLPETWHADAAMGFPAMVAAAIRGGDDRPCAVHRTYLVPPGEKAPVTPVKRMLGPVKGAAVRLSDGSGPLVVCEGIETGLSLVDVLGAHRYAVWAGLSANGVAALILPDVPGRLIIAVDPDDVGRRSGVTLADRAYAAGWHVRILPPPGDDADWNAAAMRRAV